MGEYSEAVERRIQYARRVHSKEAIRATVGIHKREDLLAKAEPSSVLKGEKEPWVLERQMTNRYFSYVPELVEPMVCDNVMRQALEPVRAHDHALQIVSGSATCSSKWVPPKAKYHGTQRREASAKELLKNHHGVQLRPETAEKRSQQRPATAPTTRPPVGPGGVGSRPTSSSRTKWNAPEAKRAACKALPRAQSAGALEARPRSQSATGPSTKLSEERKDVEPAPRPKSAIAGPSKGLRPPSCGMRRPSTGSVAVKPRP